MPERKVFTLVRMGNSERVSPWLLAPDFLAVSDVGISLYGDAFPADMPPSVVCHRYVGGKWSGIFAFFAAHPELLRRYDYFWFPDDDVETTAASACRFLDIVATEGFDLAQPALTLDSDHAHRIVLVAPCFVFRRTNFVELMLPLMSRQLLQRALPLFAGLHFGLALDSIWHLLSDDPRQRVAIVDAAPVAHRRPRRVHLKGEMTKLGVDPAAEKLRNVAELGIRHGSTLVLAARRADGSELRRGPRLWLSYLGDHWRQRRQVTGRPWTWFDGARFAFAQCCHRADRGSFDAAAYRDIAERTAETGNTDEK